ncbi:polysaccharide lyase family 7 protein [Vibrio breoganii]|uniref:polysaccharide lyase family 7 protein n=1 Tax=Vibrio breoganii TaxID=553239 RepID=UPI000CC4A3F1|nr:polysaccharide lyase family 7 protein [Vibrio breoganii]PMO34383.1 alginate lyase [Vibrio breoganii]
MKLQTKTLIATFLATTLSSHAFAQLDPNKAPSENFDLTHWKLNVPIENVKPERKGLVMEVSAAELNEGYTHPEWFYTDPQSGALVFVAPNKAMTTPNSSNARSELHAMLADNPEIGTYEPANNFAVASNKNAEDYAAVGGKLSAELAVNHVSLSGDHRHNDSFSVVIGQIHARHNEPLKIFYRKLPDHEYGSVYWNYENNALGDDYHKRLDISHNVFGKAKLRFGQEDPQDGVKLDEKISYTVNLEGDIMHLEFIKDADSDNPVKKTFAMNIAEGNYLGNKYDAGYAQSLFFYKAGAYNQCSTGVVRCTNNGMEAGDYTKVSFYHLELDQK